MSDKTITKIYIMNAPKYLRILTLAGVKYCIVNEWVIVDNEDNTYTNITNFTEKEFYNFLGF